MSDVHAAVWDVLCRHCRARPDEIDGFRYHWPECREYRFIGALGFGGKVWAYDGRWYVNCYSENETPERRAMIDAANTELAALRARYDAESGKLMPLRPNDDAPAPSVTKESQ